MFILSPTEFFPLVGAVILFFGEIYAARALQRAYRDSLKAGAKLTFGMLFVLGVRHLVVGMWELFFNSSV